MLKNKDLKRRIVEISYKLGLSHIGSCLTAVDIIDEIYKIKKPDEKFVLSAGHAHLAHLAVMQKYNYLPKGFFNLIDSSKDIDSNQIVSRLIEKYGIHCDKRAGCDVSTGSLGHGIGIAVGMALANRNKNVYCLLSDGEMAEGSVWEALRIAKEQKLTNLKLNINFNGWAAYKETDWKLINRQLEEIAAPYSIKIHRTYNDSELPFLQGQMAHYKVLNKAEYEEVMEILK